MRVGLRRPVAVVAALLAVSSSACSAPHTDTPTTAVTAKLAATVPDKLSIGVVVSQTSPLGEGAEWRNAAEGARVAANRFALGGASVTLVPVNDKGTPDGAVAAVKTLADQGVAGIVLATSGDHIAGAVQQAAARHVPVLLPYAASADALPADVWVTGPTTDVADGRLVEALEDRELSRPLLIDASGGSVEGLSPVATEVFGAGDDPVALATRLAVRQKNPSSAFDAVVISGPAELQGALVSALQGAGVGTTVLLSPDALSPSFPQTVSRTGGSLAGTFVSAGLDPGDASALEPTESGRARAAYFSALTLTAAGSATKDLFGERPFSAVAADADVRSHDAVVALVRAAERAGSADPAEVAAAMPGLVLGVPAGLAGPRLDFSHAVAVAPDDVIALAATPVSPGMRPSSPASSSAPGSGSSSGPAGSADLFWYAAAPA